MGGGIITSIAYFRLNRRQKKAEVVRTELEVSKIKDSYYNEGIQDAYKRLDDMTEKLTSLRKQLLSVMQELTDTKVSLINMTEKAKIAEEEKCTVRFCKMRIPPVHGKKVEKSA